MARVVVGLSGGSGQQRGGASFKGAGPRGHRYFYAQLGRTIP